MNNNDADCAPYYPLWHKMKYNDTIDSSVANKVEVFVISFSYDYWSFEFINELTLRLEKASPDLSVITEGWYYNLQAGFVIEKEIPEKIGYICVQMFYDMIHLAPKISVDLSWEEDDHILSLLVFGLPGGVPIRQYYRIFATFCSYVLKNHEVTKFRHKMGVTVKRDFGLQFLFK